jgi:hypothetical protein
VPRKDDGVLASESKGAANRWWALAFWLRLLHHKTTTVAEV